MWNEWSPCLTVKTEYLWINALRNRYSSKHTQTHYSKWMYKNAYINEEGKFPQGWKDFKGLVLSYVAIHLNDAISEPSHPPTIPHPNFYHQIDYPKIDIFSLLVSFMYVFVSVLGLCCCTAFSVVAESRGFFHWASHCSSFSCCKAQARFSSCCM